MNDTVHLYSPRWWHDRQIIVCNADGLALLRRLVQSDSSTAIDTFTHDGEGYELVLLVTEDIGKLAAPYTDESIGAAERNEERWENLEEAALALLERAKAARAEWIAEREGKP